MNESSTLLFLTPGIEDYLADSLFHGLRTVLGERCVDWPRRDPLYADFPAERRARLYGNGSTLYDAPIPDIDLQLRRVTRSAGAPMSA